MTRVQTEEPRTVSRAVDATPNWREPFLLLAVSFAVFWTSTFLLHKSTDFVGHYGDNAAYLDVANPILHWDFHDLQVQHFMGYPYLIAVVSLLLRIPTGVGALGDCGCRLRGVGVAHGPAVRNNGCGILRVHEFCLASGFVSGRIRAPSSRVGAWLTAGISAGSDCGFRAAGIVGRHSSTADVLRVVGIGLALLYRKQFWQFLAALGIGLWTGILYVLPLARYFGDPWLTVHT